MYKSVKNDQANTFIRERIKQARSEANETQEKLATSLQKTRVAVSDLERGRVSVSAADLLIIARHFNKPISYFFPDYVKVNEGDLSPLDEELIKLFWELPEPQKHIALEYVRQQVDVINKAIGHEASKKHAEMKSKIIKK